MLHLAPAPRVHVARPFAPGPARRPTHRADGRDDGLTPAQRHGVVAAIAVLHVAIGWALLQVREVRQAVAEAAPIFVSLIASNRAQPEPSPPRVAPPEVAPPPPPRMRRAERVLAAPAAAKPARPSVLVPEPVPEPEPVPMRPEPRPPAATAAPVVAPSPAAPPQPKTIPASAVQYLDPPSPTYPAHSRRLGETGRVTVRVFIDEAGTARDVRIDRGSGHPRLDEAALAAVLRARFKPYTENGLPLAGWAYIPIDFELER